MKRKVQTSDVGVIVGRFQVNELHDGHKALIDSVVAENERVIIFLGLSPLKTTRNNPLDFRARKQMISEIYPDIDILYINDCVSDEAWSKDLDRQISNNVGPESRVALYGSRDAFISHYSGRYPTVELVQETYVSGTSIRQAIAHKTNPSTDFRAGVIWATKNQFCNPKLTTDVAIFDSSNEYLVLGRKPNEGKFRFIWGFVNPNETAEMCAAREVQEETGLEIGGINELKHLGTHVIDDWRYRGESENILTSFYLANYKFGRPEPNDDICEVKLICLKKLPYESEEAWKTRLVRSVVDTHKGLMEVLFDKVISKMEHLIVNIEDVEEDKTQIKKLKERKS
jgi:bifunctional NMN adenylyltransferase/nudix hydrolase